MFKYLFINILFLYCLLKTNNAIQTNDETCKNSNEICVNIKKCPSLYDLLKTKPISQSNLENLKKAQCGFENADPKVCCQNQGNLDPTSSDLLLPDMEECGINLDNKIVGGTRTTLGEFPWMALLEYDKPTGRGFQCGGSLINHRYVITAAHCVGKIPKTWKLISVRLGEHNLDTNPDCEEEIPGLKYCGDEPIDVPIEKTLMHENYAIATRGQANDIALVRLSRNIDYTDFIKPICLPILTDLRNNNMEELNVTVAGWGRTENNSQSSIKLKVRVPVERFDTCSERYKKSNVDLGSGQLCAGGVQGKDSCAGDSGGPLMTLYPYKVEYYYFLVGVVSFGPTPCGLKNWPGVYTRVSNYVDWIKQNIRP